MKSRFRAIALVSFLGCAILCCNAQNEYRHLTAEEALLIVDSLQICREHEQAVEFVETYLEGLEAHRDSTISIPLALLLMRLSECYFLLGNYQKADSASLGADAIFAAADDTDSLRAFATIQRGANQWFMGNNEVAERLQLDALSILRARYGPLHPAVLYAWNAVSLHYFVSGEWESYIAFGGEYLRLLIEVNGPCDSVVLEEAHGLASAYRALEDKDRSREVLELIVAALDCSAEVYPKYVMQVTDQLGYLLSEQGDKERAVDMFTRSLIAADQYDQVDNGELLPLLQNLGNNLAGLYRYEEADSVYRRIVNLATEMYGPSDSITIELRLNLGNILMNLYRFKEADSVLSGVLSDAEEAYSSDTVRLIDPLVNYGWLFVVQGMADEAAPFLMRAKRLADCCCRTTDPNYSWALLGFAGLQRARGLDSEADSLEALADSLMPLQEKYLR